MQNSEELKQLIRENAHLFWYTKESEKENLPLEVVLEFFLNYAELEEIRKLFAIVGVKTAADIFRKQVSISERAANNYFPVTRNYFTLYFNKYAP